MLYIFSGPNGHKKRDLLLALRKRYADYAFYSFDCTDQVRCTKEILDSIFTQVTLFDNEKKIILLRSFTSFEDQSYLLSILKKIKDSKDMYVILETEDRLRSNAKVFSVCDKKNITECPAYTQEQLLSIAVKRLEQAGVAKARTVASQLLQTVDANPFSVENETEKVVLFSQTHESQEALDTIVTKSLSFSIWEYLQALTNGERAAAIQICVDLLDKGENAFGIMGMLLWNIRLMAVIASAKSKDDLQIAKDFGYSPYSIKNGKKLAQRFPLQRILLIYEKITEIDLKIKSGLIEPRLGVILLSYLF